MGVGLPEVADENAKPPRRLPSSAKLNRDDTPVSPGLAFPAFSHRPPPSPASRLTVAAQKGAFGHLPCLTTPFPRLILHGPRALGGNDLRHLIKSRCDFSRPRFSDCLSSPSQGLFPKAVSSLASPSDSRRDARR